MRIRTATDADLATLGELWRAFLREVPESDYVDVDEERELGEIAETVHGEVALLAENDGGDTVGFALARRTGSRAAELTDLYVVPDARGSGVAAALVREVVDRVASLGAEHLHLQVMAANTGARAVYGRWGFREDVLTLAAPIRSLAERLTPDLEGPALGVVYVQTDDVVAVERAASAFAPRIRSAGSVVGPPRDGWIAVHDDVAARDPAALRRLARELSDRLGAVVLALGVESGAVVRLIALERGSVLDEYLSVPEYHGPLPPGDVVALAANPTVLARLTGADPAAIRATARTAASLAELPPPLEHATAIAAALGLPPLDR